MNKIVYALCIVFILSTQVFSHDAKSPNVKVLAKTGMSWDQLPLPDYPEGKPEITILRITIPPHSELPMHKHPVINAGVLVKGKLTVITKDKKILYLNSGDAIVEVVDTWHYGKNEGDEPAEIIVFYAGTTGNPLTVKNQTETK